ncbi:DUF1583 domain-containing protein [Novipirellula maiorica]|nr:DUF1583 domain-containing protein [Rhodopirellula maiorica]
MCESVAANVMWIERAQRLPHFRGGWWRLLSATLMVLITTSPAAAIETEIADSSIVAHRPSDDAALCHLIGESVLQQYAATICLEARQLPAPQRYETLVSWVLPAHAHGFRLQGAFRRSVTATGQAEAADQHVHELNAYPESNWLLSPAIDLVQVASKLDKLGDLKRRIESIQPADKDQTIARTTLLTLFEIKRGDVQAVQRRLEARFAWQRDSKNSGSASQRWPDLLVLWSVAGNPKTSHLLSEDLFGAFSDLHQYNADFELDVVNDYLRLLKGRCYAADRRANDPQVNSAIPAASNVYDVFSRSDAATHSAARPLTRFHIGSTSAFKISGHENDYLAYRGPITGDFEVNGEVATYPGAFTELMVHAAAVVPVREGTHLSIGAMSKGNREIALDRKLEEIESSSHLRCVVRNGVVTHFFNGRSVLEHDQKPLSAPWVALKSWRGTLSEIRNLQFAGSAQIPDSIDLLSDASLSGWASYFDPALNQGLGQWNTAVGDDHTIHLVSNLPSGIDGSFDEDLIRYVRPIVWDAEISYEFQYQAGTIAVHPALGRTVFLITPAGVRIHQLTDGKFERSQLRPDNASDPGPNDDETKGKPPLHNGWNAIKIQIHGDVCTVSLNGQSVVQVQVPAHTARKFGLFRYRDQTRCVVRNLQLRGDWSNTLPVIQQQPLANREVAKLNQRAAELPDHFVHDFRNGVPAELFDFEGDTTTLTKRDDGVRMVRSADAGVRAINACMMIHGDFDISVGYKDLHISDGQPTWHCGIGLAIRLENSTFDRCALYRRRDRMHGHHYVGFGQKEMNAAGKSVWIGGANVVDESTSGRLRLVRRANQIYGLHAVGDSPSFRVVTTTTVPPGPIGVQGLQLVTEVGQGLDTSVTWTALDVRADRIDPLTVNDQAQTIEMLNSLREQKRAEKTDFTKQTPSEAGFYSTSDELGKMVSDGDGVTVTVQGDSFLKRYSLMKPISSAADFDIQTEFEILRLDRGYPDEASSEVSLQIQLASRQTVEINDAALDIFEAAIILRRKPDGTFVLRPRIVARTPTGSTVYRAIHSIPVTMPDQYRIVQHERTLYFLYSEAGSPESKVIATYPLQHKLSATKVGLWVNAGREQRVASAVWKQLRLHGTPDLLQGVFQFLHALPTQP